MARACPTDPEPSIPIRFAKVLREMVSSSVAGRDGASDTCLLVTDELQPYRRVWKFHKIYGNVREL